MDRQWENSISPHLIAWESGFIISPSCTAHLSRAFADHGGSQGQYNLLMNSEGPDAYLLTDQHLHYLQTDLCKKKTNYCTAKH